MGIGKTYENKNSWENIIHQVCHQGIHQLEKNDNSVIVKNSNSQPIGNSQPTKPSSLQGFLGGPPASPGTYYHV